MWHLPFTPVCPLGCCQRLHCVILICRVCTTLWEKKKKQDFLYLKTIAFSAQVFDHWALLIILFLLRWLLKRNSQIQLNASVSIPHSFCSKQWSRKWERCIGLYVCVCVGVQVYVLVHIWSGCCSRDVLDYVPCELCCFSLCGSGTLVHSLVVGSLINADSDISCFSG